MQVVDESAIAHNRDALNDLRIFSAQTTRLSDAVVDGDASAAQCLNRQFDAWAQANALLGPAPSAQGRFERLWALAGLSVSAFKLERSGYTLSPQTKEWLQRLAVLVQEEQRFSRSADATNMTLWAALGTGTVALLNDDQKLWLWSLGRVDNFLDHVQPDGIAPTELARRERATRYHFFAAQPLMAFDRIARCFGKPLDAEHVQSKERFLKLLRQLQRQQISLASQAGAEQLPYYRQVWFDILDKPKTASDDRDVHVDRLGGSIVAFSRASAC